MATTQHYLPGTVVVYAGDGVTKRTLAAVVSGPHEGGTFDLECKQRVPPESIRAVMGGERVEYFSSSLNNWIPSQVLRKGKLPGTFDLDCKEGVDLRRIRLPRGAAAAAPPQPAQQPWPQEAHGVPPPPPQGGGRREPSSGPPGGGMRGLLPGEHCFYKSGTHGWIPAQIARYRPEDGSYDLDVKQRVRLEAIFCVREGESVEYRSVSSGQWIPARVLRKGREPGLFDLDCKERVDLRRMRPPSGAARSSSAASRPPEPPTPPRPPPPPPSVAGVPAQDCQREAARRAARTPSPGAAPSRQTLGPRDALASAGLASCAAFSSAGGLQAASQAPSEAGDVQMAPRPTLDPPAAAHAPGPAAGQQQARAGLQRALWGREPEALREALRLAGEASLPPEELEPAEKALRQMRASADLQQAAAGRSVEALRGALRTAADAGLSPGDLGPAQSALAALEAQEARAQQAREELRRACQGEDAQAIQDALSAAATVGLEQGELASGQRTLAVLKARDELHQAIAARGTRRLRDALRAAASGGVPAEELESAKRILATLEAEAAQLQTARSGLQHAVRAREPHALQEALRVAASAGLPFEELDQARQVLDAVQTQLAARQQVHRAIATGSLVDLKEALHSATQAGVPQGELDVAVGRLQLLEADTKRSTALERLRRAVKAEDPAALRAALEAAAALGLAGDELDQAAHTLWALEARPAALAELRRCAARRDVPALLAAMEAAAAAGVAEGELEAAQRTLRGLESQRAQAEAQESLRNACQSEDADAIKQAIDSAARAGLHGPELDSATQVLREVEARLRAREELRDAEAVARRNGNAGSAAALRSALRSAEAAGLSGWETEGARLVLQRWEAPATEPQLQVPAYALGSGGASAWGGAAAAPVGTNLLMGVSADAGTYPLLAVPETDLQTLAPGTDPQLPLSAPPTNLHMAGPGAGLQQPAVGTDPQMHFPSPGASGTMWSRGAGPGAGLQQPALGTDPQMHFPSPGASGTMWSRGAGSAGSFGEVLPPTQPGLASVRSPYEALSRGCGLGSGLELPPTDPQLPMTDPQLVSGMR